MAAAGKRKTDERVKGSPQPVGTALQELVHTLGIGKTLSQYDIITSWEKVVGTPIARVSKPVRIENGILLVSVASSAWRAELTFKRNEILRKINSYTRKNSVKEIRFR